VRPIGAPPLVNTLCLATSASKRATPLTRHVTRLLRELVALKIGAGNPIGIASG
jgi:hypothetical protein